MRGQRRLAVLAVVGAFLASALLTVATCSRPEKREAAQTGGTARSVDGGRGTPSSSSELWASRTSLT